MKKTIAILVTIITLIIFSLSIYSYIQNPQTDKDSNKDTTDPTETPTSNDPIDNQETSNAINLNNSTIGNSNPEDSTNPTLEEIINPEDYECGFYSQEYGVCAGSCPEGECVSEGQSCYCKKL